MSQAKDAAAVAVAVANPAARQYLTFEVEREQYGVEILRVQEIRGYSLITPIPNTPAYIRGLINLRGTVVPVVDLRMKFGLATADYTKFTVIIVVMVGTKVMGLIVDAVSDVLDVAPEDMREVPEMGERVDTRFISGMVTAGESITVLLDIDRLLGEEETGCLVERVSEGERQ